ncbi:MAG: DNA translocase FtsK [Anaerolineae bacterium]|nr:DNA translocase FtsK [Anaerolineae bacterium]
MARRPKSQAPAPPSPVTRPHESPPPPETDAPPPIIQPAETIGLTLVAVAVLTLLSLLAVNRGALTDAWAVWVRRGLGWGALPVTLLVGLGGGWLLARRWLPTFDIPWSRLVWGEMAVLAGLALAHLPGAGDPLDRAWAGQGGGLMGYVLAWTVADLGGRWVSALVWLAVLSVALLGVLGLGPRSAYRQARELGTRRRAAPALPLPQPVPVGTAALPQEMATPTDQAAAPPTSRPRKKTAEPLPDGVQGVTPQLPMLPPIELLERGSKIRYRDDEIRERSQIIEETLAAFGVPARVVSVNQGPAITQFGIEPGYIERRGADGGVERRKIKVSKILSLQNDLALALAAPSLRIEAPVPGRSVVGLEVPNGATTRVALRNLMETPAYQKMTSSLRLALGENVRGAAVVADLGRMPHLLIAGQTGSGKSVCINSIIACLLYNNTPDTLKLLLVDPKRVELVGFNGIPHLLAPVVVEMEEVVGALRWAIQEMDQRYQLFAAVGVRNVDSYNKKVATTAGDPLPYIVIIVDELADLMMVAADEAERLICRLAQLARATGIHLILATQRPSTDVVTGLIKANFPARIAFAVASQIDSRVILDYGGAEKLLGRGDMLYVAPDAPAPERLQGVHVTDRELDKLVKFWRRVAGPTSPPTEPPPWAGLLGEEDSADEKLIAEATTLVRQYRTASVSFLQRRLRIGYPRAARLLDELEERGVIGPAENGRSRPVLHVEDEEAMTSEQGLGAREQGPGSGG